MSHFIPLSVPNLRGNEKKYVNDAIDREWVSTGGAYIDTFEKNLADYVHMTDAVACQSGTAGLHLGLIAGGIAQNQEVIVPALTFIASVNPVSYVGAEPIFMDCDDSLCMDMEKLERFCAEECTLKDEKLYNTHTGKHVAAVVIVHIFGNLADMQRLMDIAQKYHLLVIEDACEALGSKFLNGPYAGRHAGTIGDIGVFSFNGNKIITTGGGGMVISRHKHITDIIRHLSTQAKADPVYFVHDQIGYNYRMTNIQAAIGVGQLEQLQQFIDHKKMLYEHYKKAGLELLPFRENTRPNYWFFSYLVQQRDETIRIMGENNVQIRPIWHLIHRLPMYKHCFAYKIEQSEFYWKRLVNLPCSTNLSIEDANRVISVIQSIERD